MYIHEETFCVVSNFSNDIHENVEELAKSCVYIQICDDLQYFAKHLFSIIAVKTKERKSQRELKVMQPYSYVITPT